MRRIRSDRENETLENAQEAFERYADQKHKRWNVMRYEEHIDENTHRVLQEIIEESFVPSGYQEKWIYDKKPRKLAKAPVYDHHAEAAHMLPYEQQVYDHISWRAPAVRPNLGTHAMMRFIRNCLFRNPQVAVAYYIMIDVHHYFPLMDHEMLKKKISNKFKAGKLRNFIFRVIDSYPQGAPLGIKLAQLFGMLYLADFDRLLERFFDIPKDPEKMAYWTRRYITEWILTAKSPDEQLMLGRGSQYLAERFRRFAEEGMRFSFRFVDNILVMHEDKAFLRITRELIIMTLTRDYRAQINQDYNVRPVWMGIRLVGYTYFHERTAVAKSIKKNLARRAHRLAKLGFGEEDIRIKLASQLGYVKHANSINLIKKIGMEKSLGKIIKNRRIKPPFKGMNPSQKVPFSSLIVKEVDKDGGGVNSDPVKILLMEYTILESKIDKETHTVVETDSTGQQQQITRQVPAQVLAIRFKKILQTITRHDSSGEEQESYIFQKKREEDGQLSTYDAEYYAFTGSRIMIDQAQFDFSPEDLPCPTVIRQVRGKDGKLYTKFT